MTGILLYAGFENKERFDFESELFDCVVVFYLEKGSFEFKLGEVSGTAKAGQAVICKPGVRFERRALGPMKLHVLRLKTDADYPDGLVDPAGKARIIEDLSRFPSNTLIMNFTDAEAHFLLDVWYALTLSERRPGVRDRLMEKAKSTLDGRLCEKVTIAEISRGIGLSPVAFLRRFRKAFGVTPGGYLASARINRARELLVSTDLTLAAIASECGFENEYYFSASFKKSVGVPPGRYRRESML